MDINDLEAMVKPEPQPEKKQWDKPYNKDFKKKPSVNMYEVETITSKKIDTDSFEKVGKSFAVHTFEADEDTIKKLVVVATILVEQGFVFRHNGRNDDKLQNKILEIDNINVEHYLPYKAYNSDIPKSIIVNYYELPFNYAAELYGQKFNDLKKGSKAIYANQVQTLLGKECNNPVDMLLCYSPDGSERPPVYEKGKKYDYSKLGSLNFYLRVADVTGISVYNFKNSESIQSLVKLIK